ncbi:MAG: PQQ-binding-like beta-propeller repeat protein [Candidatus Aenigmarchaeota archaeon]|nr:PQQ-binding-like beta-propeller repeat protein [Candidatus Aenigmarchaeota archaeon]
MDLGESGFSGFDIELEDFELVKKEHLFKRGLEVGPGGSILSVPKIIEGIVYFGSMDFYIYALDCETGKLIWRFKTDGDMACNSAEGDKERIYMGTKGGSLYAFEAKTGKLIWRFKAGDGVITKPFVWRDKVFFPCLDGNLYCLNSEGKEIWRFKTGDSIFYAPAVYSDKIYFGSADGNFYCLDTKGKEIWRFRAGEEITNELPATYYKGVIYFASMNNFLYAVDAETGKEIWRFRTGKYGNCCSPIIYNDVIFHSSRDGIIYAITLDGEEMWRFRAGGLTGISLTYYKNRLYFGSEDSNIYCLDPKTGKEIWRFKSSGPMWSPPVVWKDKLYDGSWDCHFYCIDLKGKEVWRFPTSNQTISEFKPPYSMFEVTIKKKEETEEEGEEKYGFDLRTRSSEDEYSVKNEYASETAYATKKDYGD